MKPKELQHKRNCSTMLLMKALKGDLGGFCGESGLLCAGECYGAAEGCEAAGV